VITMADGRISSLRENREKVSPRELEW
jgi:hypothetical protein